MTTLSTGYSSNTNFHDQGVGFMPTKTAERSVLENQVPENNHHSSKCRLGFLKYHFTDSCLHCAKTNRHPFEHGPHGMEF